MLSHRTARASVPFRLVGGSQPLILLDAFVNGNGPFDFILDSGAGFCLITPTVASEARVDITGERTGTGAAGAVTLSMGSAGSIAVGSIEVPGLRVGVTSELARIGSAVGARIDGVIGYEFLRDFCVTLDYANQTINLAATSRQTEAPPDSASVVRFSLAYSAKPLILVDAFLNDRGPFVFALDTGASITTISHDVAAQLRLSTSPIPSMTGGGGAVDAALSHLRSLRVAAREIFEIDVAVSRALDLIAGAIGRKLDGILGYNFLKHYRVMLDYPNETLALLD